jgi:transposase InsO family protein
VADITYIALERRDVCYLHLITDAYVGWALADSLKAAITMQTLQMAVDQAVAMSGIDTLKGLIHYSDRGVQYCCDTYVKMLQTYGCTISMTEDYKPTDNAIAESVNGKIKVESVYRQKRFNSLVHAGNVIGRYIHFYNYHRPHMSIGLRCRLLPIWSKASREKCGRTKFI